MPNFFSITIILFGDNPHALHDLGCLQQSVSDIPGFPAHL
jgi:hypothetical protein